MHCCFTYDGGERGYEWGWNVDVEKPMDAWLDVVRCLADSGGLLACI